MKNPYFLFAAAFFLLQSMYSGLHAQVPDFTWSKQAGGAEGDAASRVAVDAGGNSYVTGIFRGVASFGTVSLTSSGSTDIFVAKYDASGNLLWAKQAGGQNIDASKNIAVDSNGNSYITGEFMGNAVFGSSTLTSSGSYDAFVAKYDASGNLLWAKQSGGAGLEMGRGIAVDGSGNCFVTGYFDGSATFGNTTLTSSGSYDVFLARYDASGNFQWAARAGGSGDDFGRNVALDGSGASFITGTFRGLAGFGSTALASSGLEDIFIARYDATGTVLWAKSAGGTAKDASTGIDVDGSGSSYITGEFHGSAAFGSTTLTSASSLPDIFIARYDVSGNVLWAKRAGGSTNDFGRNIAVDASGNSYITGEFDGTSGFGNTTLTSAGGVDIFVAAYDASGNSLWAKRAGGNQEDRAAGITIDGNGNSYVSGYFFGTASFDSTQVSSNGASDIYLAKLSIVNATGLSQTSGFQFMAYPNPFANLLTIELTSTDPATATLYDLLGREVHTQLLIPGSAGTALPVAFTVDLPSGAYLLRVQQSNNILQMRVMRE